MKRIVNLLLIIGVLFTCQNSFASQTQPIKNTKTITYNKNARTIQYAFVFDGPSDKNAVFLKHFQNQITASAAPEFRASFPKELVFVGDWTKEGSKKVAQKAMNSKATMVIALGYLSTKTLNEYKDKKKFVITVDQYGLRDLGDGFFNPIQQSIKGILAFHRLINFKKVAIIMNESFYKTRSNWYTAEFKNKLPNIDYVVIPSNHTGENTFNRIPADCDAVVLTPLFNLPEAERKNLISLLTAKKIPTYSTLGKEDVELGALVGTGAYDLDRKIAESLSFNIKSTLNGKAPKYNKLQFYEDEIFYINEDTAEAIGYDPHLRVLNNAEIISKKKATIYNLSAIFDTLEKRNLDIERKKLLVKAARRSAISAGLRYLPTFGITVGYQQYNYDYAKSASLLMPEKTGVFQMSLDQVIYSPALVTNILVKKKQLDFQKEEAFLTEQNMGLEVAQLYIDSNIIDNVETVQREYVKESRENLAIARVREQMGVCGKEEALRWATQLSVNEKELLKIAAENKNVKLAINKLLFKDQKEKFKLAPLSVKDPAFYTSELNIIDYVAYPKALEQFIQMTIDQAYEVAPELAKLKAAQKMKKYEMGMYIQKFILPDAKLSLEYQSLMNREYATPLSPVLSAFGVSRANPTNLRFGIFAQWKPIEGGTKFAEIARIKAELDELKLYEEEVKTEIERHVRDVINNAIADYFSIEKNYKAMFASRENYLEVKRRYLRNESTIAQLIDAQKIYLDSKVAALNSQAEFLKQLVWLQRGICAVNWTKASPEAKKFIERVKTDIKKNGDIPLL